MLIIIQLRLTSGVSSTKVVDPLLGSSECVAGRSRVHSSWPALSGHGGQICSELRDTSRSIRRNSENGYY